MQLKLKKELLLPFGAFLLENHKGQSLKFLALANLQLLKSTITNFVKDLVKYAPQFIKFPKSSFETANAIQLFQTISSCELPQAVGAIDGTHVEIFKPFIDSAIDYYSRKQKFTVNTQAVVGGNLLFLDVASGYPGSIHDARMLRASRLFNDEGADLILTRPTDVIDDHQIRPFLLGDGAYPSLSWLVKPYPQNIRLTNSQKRFNKKLSSARVTVERAFGVLKARWRCLLKRLNNNFNFVPLIIIACCVLHNICQNHNDIYVDEDEILDAIIQRERQIRQMRLQNNPVGNYENELRDILMRYLEEN